MTITPNDMDLECIKLFKALNKIPGITTFSSCCGHGTNSFDIWFHANGGLGIIARLVDSRYAGIYPLYWRCELNVFESEEDRHFCFNLTSGDLRGEEAYNQANKIAENVEFLLRNAKRWKLIK